ncbi:hypothetical protein AWJ20_474 [Sugiyamaella lignohabitans]|uniref:Major facilitator superfamily (MFS) profile domain-containing protein n=1 Tax=Sugiyamaella lignohabitans TaxID=796027 RepID=A0A167CXG8_9ASCO|nr:uncharacterized protein AWJ20_474 [Sugiyamaella lignohabitans]ANB12225.1 hypothetical protein AWJ20_474 [Sugiyamaella lignohabitans]
MRFVRLVAFGQTSIILVLYFKSIGITETLVGIFMSLTLFGDVFLSFVLTLYADRLGRRNVLTGGALMMTLSGIVFVLSNNFYVLLIAAIIGVISPSGGEIGPFRAVEESCLAQLVSLESRADVYAWSTVLGGLGGAIGSISGGYLIRLLQDQYSFSPVESYKGIYVFYSVCGALKLLFTVLLTKNVELHPDDKKAQDAVVAAKAVDNRAPNVGSAETDALLQGSGQPAQNAAPVKSQGLLSRLMPHLSHESKKIVFLLSCLFAVDALGSSMTNSSWTSYYISRKFGISESFLGSIFFTTGLVSCVGSLLGSSISKRLGPLITMVVTHLPSSILQMFVPYPNTVHGALLIMIIRASTCTMDVAPRQTFLSSVVLKSERTAVMGWVNVVKTLAQMIGPTFTGHLTGMDMQWLCFVIGGALKVLYDLGILSTFLNVKLDRDHN